MIGQPTMMSMVGGKPGIIQQPRANFGCGNNISFYGANMGPNMGNNMRCGQRNGTKTIFDS